MQLSAEVDGPVPKGETKARRFPDFKGELQWLPYQNDAACNTPCHVLQKASTNFATRSFLGHREYLPGGARGDYQWQNYKSVTEDVAAWGTGLVKLCGLTSSGSGEKQARLGIYAINRPEWTKFLLAGWSQSITGVPLYDTLGANAVKYIIDHSELTTVACERTKLKNVIGGKGATLKYIVCPFPFAILLAFAALATQLIVGPGFLQVLFEDATAEEKGECEKAGLKLISISELAKAGEGAELKPTATPEDWAYIMYTSGTTGDPKGVILTQQNILASASGLLRQNEKVTNLIQADDVYISFLPLAHSFEACMQCCAMTVGAAVGFYQGDVKKLITDDLPALKPTVMAGVPRIYARIYDKVMAGIEAKGGLVQTLFKWGMEAQMTKFIFDLILFRKIRKVLGGRIRLFASGAAPLSADLHHFLTKVFGCPVLQGYGMTENAAAAIVMPYGYDKGGNVGGPTSCVEMKLQDTEDYKCTDVYPATAEAFESQVSFKGKFNSALAGKTVQRGEVCLRGFNVFKGYFKNEKETKETLDSDNWLHTGDIGMFNDDGSLSIIDRKKNIFKLAQGEYVSPEAVEIAVGACKWVGQVWVYGNSYENYVVAICVPDVEVFATWMKKENMTCSIAEALAQPKVKAMVFADLIAAGKAAKLRGFELPKKIDFEPTVNNLGQGFTIEDDLITPTLKIRRPQMLKKYQKKIDVMYAEIKEEEEKAKKAAV
mmetsp:Transcript_42804/g.67087  ORF Transcript_42804/g.67087 Transcript_42804/m.67087 type:complete len:717 (-) Transcript_42804:219-2369(-)